MRNTAKLLDIAGDDYAIAQAAWTSTTTRREDKTDEDVAILIKLLWNERHTTPFEHTFLKFHCTVDNATHIQMIRHRAGVSFNVESARYKEYRHDKYHIPCDWESEFREALVQHSELSFEVYHDMIERLEAAGMTRKRAKESARYFLPMSLQLEIIVTFNLHSFLHFLELRLSEHAQQEIHDIAEAMLTEVQKTGRYQYALKAALW